MTSAHLTFFAFWHGCGIAGLSNVTQTSKTNAQREQKNFIDLFLNTR